MDTAPLATSQIRTPGSGGSRQEGENRGLGLGPQFQNLTQKETTPVVSNTYDIIKKPEVLPQVNFSGIQKSARELAENIQKKVKYNPEFIEHMLDYFIGREKSRTVTDYYSYKNGATGEKEREIGNPPPMFSEFGRMIGVSERQLKGWAKTHADFGEAYQMCEDVIKEFIVENGVSGAYSGQLTVFIAKNITSMKDTIINENHNMNLKKFLDQLEKGETSNNQDPV